MQVLVHGGGAALLGAQHDKRGPDGAAAGVLVAVEGAARLAQRFGRVQHLKRKKSRAKVWPFSRRFWGFCDYTEKALRRRRLLISSRTSHNPNPPPPLAPHTPDRAHLEGRPRSVGVYVVENQVHAVVVAPVRHEVLGLVVELKDAAHVEQAAAGGERQGPPQKKRGKNKHVYEDLN